VEAFNTRKERQANRGRRSSVREETAAPSNEESAHGSEHSVRAQEKGHEADHHEHHHDEAADVLEEADEDMVIY
jgi:hypothetical protein